MTFNKALAFLALVGTAFPGAESPVSAQFNAEPDAKPIIADMIVEDARIYSPKGWPGEPPQIGRCQRRM